MRWLYQLKINNIMEQIPADVGDDDILPASFLAQIKVELDTLPPEIRCRFPDLSCVSTVDEFNDWMGDACDVADYHKIWMGMP
jgi:hypothetical protein